MPRDGNVAAKSGDGSIRIEHVRGRLELRTGDGSIRATDIGGQLTLATGDGSVTLDDVDGDLDVDTGDGSVSVAGKLGAWAAHRRRLDHVPRGAGHVDEGRLVDHDRRRRRRGLPAVGLRRGARRAHRRRHRSATSCDSAEADERPRQASRRTLKGKLGAGGKLLQHPHRRRLDQAQEQLAGRADRTSFSLIGRRRGTSSGPRPPPP